MLPAVAGFALGALVTWLAYGRVPAATADPDVVEHDAALMQTATAIGPFNVSADQLARLRRTLACWADADVGTGGAWVYQDLPHTLWWPDVPCGDAEMRARCGPFDRRGAAIAYRWEPSPACPQAPPWNRSSFAPYLRAPYTVAVVGDSMSREFSETLHAALNCQPYAGDPANVAVVHHRNDRLSMGTTRIDGAANFVEYQFYPQAVGDAAVRVVVLNRGTHYEDTETVLQAIDALVAALRRDRPDLVVVYRTTPPGHPNCGPHQRDAPLRHDDVLRLRANRSAAPHHWGDLPAQNQAVRRMLEARHPHVLLLDVEPMTEPRRDSHWNEHDCLHYCTPGPVDAWVEAFGRLMYALGQAGHNRL